MNEITIKKQKGTDYKERKYIQFWEDGTTNIIVDTIWQNKTMKTTFKVMDCVPLHIAKTETPLINHQHRYDVIIKYAKGVTELFECVTIHDLVTDLKRNNIIKDVELGEACFNYIANHDKKSIQKMDVICC